MNWYRKAQNSENNGKILYHGSDNKKIEGNLRVSRKGFFGESFHLTAYPEYAKVWGKFVHKMIIPNGLKIGEVIVSDQHPRTTTGKYGRYQWQKTQNIITIP